MKRILILALGALLAACDTRSGAPGGAPSATTPPAAAGTEKPAAATPAGETSAAGSGKEVKAVADKSAGELQQAVAKTTEEAQKALQSLSAEEVGKIAEPSTTVEKLKGMLAGLDTKSLTAIADKLLGALKGEEGSLAGLKDELAKVGLDLSKATALKDKIASATSVVTGLKDKLRLTVDALKARGADVSKYSGSV